MKFDLICEEILNKIGAAKIFFLPDANNKFYYVSIIYRDKIYEIDPKTKSHSIKNAKSPESIEMLEDATIVWVPIDSRKLLWELNSGTDNTTYVARVIGIDNTTKDDEVGTYSIDDIYEYVHNTNKNTKSNTPNRSDKLTFTWDKTKNKTTVTFIQKDKQYTYVNDDGNPDLNEAFFDRYKRSPGRLFNYIKGSPHIFKKNF